MVTCPKCHLLVGLSNGIERPSGLSVDRRAGSLAITKSRLGEILILPILVIVGIVSSVLAYRSLHDPGLIAGPLIIIPLSYLVLADKCNSTSLTLNPTCLVVQHHPLPQPGIRLISGEIQRLYSEAVEGENGYFYQIMAVLLSGKKVSLSIVESPQE